MVNLIGLTLDQVLDGETERSFDPDEFGYEDLGFVSLVDLVRTPDDDSDTGSTYALAAACSEPLEFHRNQYPELFEPFEDESEEAELTAAGFAALVTVFRERYDGIDILDQSDGYLRFEVYATEERGDFPIDALDEGTLWPVLAQIANELDPGTFGSDYIFNLIHSEWKKAQAE